VTYNGDTSGKPNLVTSVRLEWDTAPDDALLFVAPQAGTYTIAMPSEPAGCGASSRDFQSMADFNESACPGAGSVAAIDGIYTAGDQIMSNTTLTQGQHLVIFVSCPTWASSQSGAYTLSITKQ
jgi:hypothetical protein